MTILDTFAAAKTQDEARSALMGVLGSIASQLDTVQARGEGDAAKLEVYDRSIADLRSSMDEVKVSLAAATYRDVQGPESELRGFVGKDGRVRMTGGKSDERLYQDGLLDTAQELGDWHRDLKRLFSAYNLARAVRLNPMGQPGEAPKLKRALVEHAEKAPANIKRAIFGDTSNDSWIPTQLWVPDLDRDLRLMAEGSVMAQFATVQMSGKVLTYPFAMVGGRPYLQGAPNSNPAQYTASLPGTEDRTHTARTLAMRYELDRDSEEDAIVDVLSAFVEQMAADLTDAEEDAGINGDTTASHGDTGLANWDPNGRWSENTGTFGGSDDHRRAWIGLRHRALDIGSTATLDMGSLQTFDGVMQLRSKLGARYGRATIGICSEKFMYLKILTMDEVQKSDSTVGTASPDGRVLTLAGMPLFTSIFMADDLNATGLYDNSTKTKSGIVLANKLRFKRMIRRGAMVEIAPDITRGKLDIVSTWRGRFGTNDGPTTRNVVYGYNLL